MIHPPPPDRPYRTSTPSPQHLFATLGVAPAEAEAALRCAAAVSAVAALPIPEEGALAVGGEVATGGIVDAEICTSHRVCVRVWCVVCCGFRGVWCVYSMCMCVPPHGTPGDGKPPNTVRRRETPNTACASGVYV